MNATFHQPTAILNLDAIKARQKATWESGDFGQIARSNEPVAEEFMNGLQLRSGLRVLDAACGTGNLAILAARAGCVTSGIDIAGNLITQARDRAAREELTIEFEQADAEALPFADDEFDLVASMFGVMFAPRPEIVATELHRVTKPGGRIALANWTPEGFIGQMFQVFKKHLPPPPTGVPSPMHWGDEVTVRSRLEEGFTNLQLTRRIARLRYQFSPAGTVDFFRQYYGPTKQAFESLPADAQSALRRDLVEFQATHNIAHVPDVTEVAAEYLEIIATKN